MLQHSVFSTSLVNGCLAVAEVFREMGHTVDLLAMPGGGTTWWDDCSILKKYWTVVPLNDAK